MKRQKTSMKIDLTAMSAALMLPQPRLITLFKDGRVAAPFAEEWARAIYQLAPRLNRNSSGFDFVRVLTDKVNFAPSGNQGKGRETATKEALIEFVRSRTSITIVDAQSFPRIDFYPIDQEQLVRFIEKGWIDGRGISRERFLFLLGGAPEEEKNERGSANPETKSVSRF